MRIVDRDGRCRQIAELISSGKGVCESCRMIGISEKTFYRWKSETTARETETRNVRSA